MDTSLSFSKIVATPNLASWSQAYNAGKLFAVLSLEKKESEDQSIDSLNVLGKSFFEKLEQEFFTLETKDLESIKKAILNSFEDVPPGLNVSFALVFFSKNVLYVFILGQGNILIKRDGKIGSILRSSDDNPKNISSSSGFVNDNDLIILETSAFSETISQDELLSSLEKDNPTDSTETLSPKIHKTEDGRLASIIIKYTKPKAEESVMETIESEDLAGKEETPNEEKTENVSRGNNKLNNVKDFAFRSINRCVSLFKVGFKQANFRANPKKKIFFIAAIVIAIFLIFSISAAVKNQNNAKIAALFSEVFPQAEKKYDEGESLLDLNKNLAKDSFITAQKILEENKSKFPEKSKEKEQLVALLKNVNDKLTSISSLDKVSEDRSKLSVSVKNGSGVAGAAAKASDFLKGLGYNVVSTGNADRDDYKNTKIQVKEAKKEFLDILKGDLSKNYTIGETSSDLPDSSTEDALIIIGK